VDTLLVAGGLGAREQRCSRDYLDWLGDQAARARRFGSICTGAWVLAEAGLLDGRRATTHWGSCGELARRYPRVTVDPDPIYVRDGNCYTSAGVTAGIDLALALVEEDLGRAVALRVARLLVVFLRRPGGQAQFSTTLAAQARERGTLGDLVAWMADHVRGDLSVAALARRAAMSPRNFARHFADEVGTTPARYVEGLRLEAARRRLEATTLSVEEVAGASGFGSAEILRRAFRRRLGVTPGQYRTTFGGAA
jgi:transcriptional regulator GlxA family with amidase domain